MYTDTYGEGAGEREKISSHISILRYKLCKFEVLSRKFVANMTNTDFRKPSDADLRLKCYRASE